ncbi:hypothetical protein C4D60_Mb06t05250 [Musa balbisiana]|uniref:Uncharacterized protein n=1 Tax=Musa balbisiana TaxID=52838 RepID=A0A4S8IKP9_MUSBA|nr:hypothetical protein C4D60_Mb06t05250 [Musa balbisiana]
MATRFGVMNGISMARVPCPGSIKFLTSQQPSTSRKQLIFSLCLKAEGIFPNNRKYKKNHISSVSSEGKAIQCNTKSGKQQLYQVHICVNKLGKQFINCKVSIKRKCTSPEIVFPRFPIF